MLVSLLLSMVGASNSNGSGENSAPSKKISRFAAVSEQRTETGATATATATPTPVTSGDNKGVDALTAKIAAGNAIFDGYGKRLPATNEAGVKLVNAVKKYYENGLRAAVARDANQELLTVANNKLMELEQLRTQLVAATLKVTNLEKEASKVYDLERKVESLERDLEEARASLNGAAMEDLPDLPDTEEKQNLPGTEEKQNLPGTEEKQNLPGTEEKQNLPDTEEEQKKQKPDEKKDDAQNSDEELEQLPD